MGFSSSVPNWDMWIGVFRGGGERRGRVCILRTLVGDCGGGMVRGLRALHAAHRRITDARACMSAYRRKTDLTLSHCECVYMTHLRL